MKFHSLPNLRYLFLIISLLTAGSSATAAIILLDNTSDGTSALGNTGSILSSPNTQQGIQFTVSEGYAFDFQSFKIGFDSGGGADFMVRLFDWNDGTPILLETETFTPAVTTSAYRDFTFTENGFQDLGEGSYLFTISSSSFFWKNLSTATTPTSLAEGLTFDNYRRTTTGGITWGTSSSRNAIQLSGVSSMIIPEPSSMAWLAAAACFSMAIIRRGRRS